MHIANVLVSLYCFTSATREPKRVHALLDGRVRLIVALPFAQYCEYGRQRLEPQLHALRPVATGLGEALHPFARHLIRRDAVAIVRKHFADASWRLCHHLSQGLRCDRSACLPVSDGFGAVACRRGSFV